eukprot:360049-Chlamydomonas_euryale.AAC.1
MHALVLHKLPHLIIFSRDWLWLYLACARGRPHLSGLAIERHQQGRWDPVDLDCRHSQSHKGRALRILRPALILSRAVALVVRRARRQGGVLRHRTRRLDDGRRGGGKAAVPRCGHCAAACTAAVP